jgi:hypothetical protein
MCWRGPCCYLVARSIGIISAALRAVSSIGRRADSGGSDAYRHSAAYRCTTINARAVCSAIGGSTIDATVIDAGAMNAAICQGVS